MRRRKRTSSLTRAVAGDVAKCTSAASITMNHKRQRDASEPVDEAAVGVDVGVAVNQNEQKQQKHKAPELPEELWAKILESVHENSVAAFACVSKSLRRVQKESGRKLETDLRMKKMEERGAMMSEEWCLWAMSFLIVARQEEQSRQIFNAAAFSGHLGALKYWKEQTRAKKKSLLDEQTCAFAALGGQMEVLMWLRGNDCLWDEWTCETAARGGHLEVLKYAHEHRCPWDEWTCVAAAQRGHLEVLKYLHEKGCPWDEETCHYAAEGGHLEMLKYAHEKGCPWDEDTCYEAAEGGHLEVLEYLRENGCPEYEDTSSVSDSSGDLSDSSGDLSDSSDEEDDLTCPCCIHCSGDFSDSYGDLSDSYGDLSD